MTLLFITALLLIVAGLCAWNGDFSSTSSWNLSACWAMGLFVVGAVFLVITLLVNLTAIDQQINDQENVKRSEANVVIYRQRANDMVPQFKQLLAVEYPQYEQKIFSEINNTTAALNFLGHYPEIKASNTIIKLVNEVRDLRDKIYDQRLHKQELLASIRERPRSPWYISSLIP